MSHFCAFRIDRAIYIFVFFCILRVWNLKQRPQNSGELVGAKDIPGYLSVDAWAKYSAHSGGDNKILDGAFNSVHFIVR